MASSITSPVPQRINMRMIENVRLIWLDANIDENGVDCKNALTHLRTAINIINTYTNSDNCIQFLQQIKDDKVCMIISDSLGQHIVPCVHHMFQVDSIFIFHDNKEYHEQWTKYWSKIKGVYTDITLICDALKQAAKDCEQNAVTFSLVSTSTDATKADLDRLDPMFMYTQILKEILLTIEFEGKHVLTFTSYCREILQKDNTKQLGQINIFEKDYKNRTPIWWYTWESFLYPMLNRALRLSEIDIIVKMGFFISDLHRQIDELHQQQFTDVSSKKIFTVYRGQGMSKEEFEKISNTKGGLISFNNFLSTSMVEKVSIDFAERAARKDPAIVGVLFAIEIDPTKSTTCFGSVAEVGAYKNREKEILFAMHTVFRIRDIKPMDGNKHLFRVELELTSDNDEELQVLTKRIREETFPNSRGWIRLALVLRKLSKPAQAEDIYQTILTDTADESKNGWLYCQLGSCKKDQEEHEKAIEFYKNSIEIYEKYSPDDLNLASVYHNIASVYSSMCKYVEALPYYEKALTMQEQSSSSNPLDLAYSYSNIGLVCISIHKYNEALPYLEKALEIQQQSQPFNHPDLAASYENIAVVHRNKGEYDKASSCYEKALAIRQQSQPSDHPHLGMLYNNMGCLHEDMKNFAQAHSYYEKAVKIGQQSLPLSHPHLEIYKNNFDRVKNNL